MGRNDLDYVSVGREQTAHKVHGFYTTPPGMFLLSSAKRCRSDA